MNIDFNYRYKSNYFFLRQLLCFLRKKYLNVNLYLKATAQDKSKDEIAGFTPSTSYQSYLFTEN